MSDKYVLNILEQYREKQVAGSALDGALNQVIDLVEEKIDDASRKFRQGTCS